MWHTLLRKMPKMVSADEALPGRDVPIDPGSYHAVFNTPLMGYAQEVPNAQRLILGMGCFWGAERLFWREAGVLSTAVGYAGGYTPHPTYQEVCSGHTGHTEVVQIYFDPQQISLNVLLKLFWENHDPTQGMRQGNDVGTQYRSALYWTDAQQERLIKASAELYQNALQEEVAQSAAGDAVTTDLAAAPTFYYAEEYHQQYLHKNPGGYCGLRGTGVTCSI